MLGRLFAQKSHQSLGQGQHTVANPAAIEPLTLQPPHEDPYTRDILYGLLLPLAPPNFSVRQFRLLVCQDGGNLRSKQTLYDSAADALLAGLLPAGAPLDLLPPPTSRHPVLRPSVSHTQGPFRQGADATASPSQGLSANQQKAPFASAKLQHNINDLNDYMFGRGLPLSERHPTMKIHMLPTSSLAQGAYPAVLITRLFLIVDANSMLPESELTPDSAWNPSATMPTKLCCLRLPQGLVKSPESAIPTRSTFSSRFAVGIVIPLSDASESIEEIVSCNWEVICQQLILLQKFISKKLIQILKISIVHNSSPYINNKRILFPLGLFRGEADLAVQLHKLVKLFVYNVNTPRLINQHSLIAYGLDNPKTRFKGSPLNWALEVINWLDYKDGKNNIMPHSIGSHTPSNLAWARPNESLLASNTFLATLMATIAPLRSSLAEGVYVLPSNADGHSNMPKGKSIARIVVMTTNAVVAKKLIFILSGLIPDIEFQSQLLYDPTLDNRKNGSSCRHHDSEDALSHAMYENTFSLENNNNQGRAVQPINPFQTLPEQPSQPIPIRNPATHPRAGGSDGASASSTKGWEVPLKSMASLSFTGASKPVESMSLAKAQQIPMAKRNSASNTSSMAYLSSSLNSSLSSSASNYSLSKLGGSFMDKWKSSMLGSSKLYGQSLNAEYFDSVTTPELTPTKILHASTRSPSPGLEIAEPIYEISGASLPSSSPHTQKVSRAQSFLNLSSETPNNEDVGSASAQHSSFSIDRTRLSVFVPVSFGFTDSSGASNSKLIKRKIQTLTQSRIKHHKKDEHTLRVEVAAPRPSMFVLPLDDSLPKEGEMPSAKRPLQKRHHLQRNVAFVDEFRPELVLQSCPANPRLESQVMGAMKNDLLFFHNNCGIEDVTTRTVFISLRAREIKMIEMNVEHAESKRSKSLTPTGMPPAVGCDLTAPCAPQHGLDSNSPVSSYFGNLDHHSVGTEKRDNTPRSSFRTKIKKVFTPQKNPGDKAAVSQVESLLERLSEVASLINTNAITSSETKNLYNRLLLDAVRELTLA